MRFNELHRLNFNTSDGAYSIVTEREVEDSQITLTGEEYDLVTSHLGQHNIHRGNVKSDPAGASQPFDVLGADGEFTRVALNLVYPKPEKDELRLYLRVNAFKPEPKHIWFLFVCNSTLVVGSMPEAAWRAIGRSDAEDDIYQADIVDLPSSASSVIAPKYYQISPSIRQQRDPNLARLRFEEVGFVCERSEECRLFHSRVSGRHYLEAHHLIPIQFQGTFVSSLDIIENIVALCPFCHRAIHHAEVSFTRALLNELYEKHESLLDRFDVSFDRLTGLYNCEEILSD